MCGMAGAIYCATDMIIMQKFKQKCKPNYFLKVTITIDDVVEKTVLYKMDNIPQYVQEIYNYVNNTSVLEYDSKNEMYTLYGDHICRARDYKFALGKFPSNPLSQEHTLSMCDLDSDDVLDEILVDICKKMKAANKIACNI